MKDYSARVGIRRRRPAIHTTRNQGAALVIGLLILVVMMILGLSGMRSSVLEELMAGQTKQQNNAFQAAEAGLQAALNYLASLSAPPMPDAQGSAHVWPACEIADTAPTSCPSDPFDSFNACCFIKSVIAKWQAYDPAVNGSVLVGTPLADFGGAGLDAIETAKQPHAVIVDSYIPSSPTQEQLQNRFGTHYFTVVAVGLDAGNNSRAILQTTVTRSYP